MSPAAQSPIQQYDRFIARLSHTDRVVMQVLYPFVIVSLSPVWSMLPPDVRFTLSYPHLSSLVTQWVAIVSHRLPELLCKQR